MLTKLCFFGEDMKNTKNIFTGHLIVLFILLEGCIPTEAVRRSNSMQSNINQTNDDASKCYSEIESDINLKTALNNVIAFSEDERYRLLTSKEKTSQDINKNLIIFLSKTDKCLRIEANGMSKVNAGFQSIYITLENNRREAYLDFMDGDTTVGDLHRKLEQIKSDFLIERSVLAGNINQNLISNHNLEIEQRQRDFQRNYEQGIREYNRQQEIERINELRNKSQNTRCTTWGNTTNCTTQ